MTVHYCPSCGAYNWYPSEGTTPWRLECQECGHVAAQEPHPPVAKREKPVLRGEPARVMQTKPDAPRKAPQKRKRAAE